MGTTAAQKKLFFNLRRLKGQMQAIEDGDLSPERVTAIAEKLDVSEADVVSMNRRLQTPDHSLHAPLRPDGEGDRQDWVVDEAYTEEARLAQYHQLSQGRRLLHNALEMLSNSDPADPHERGRRSNPTP